MDGAGPRKTAAGYDGRSSAEAGQTSVSAGKMLVESYTNQLISEMQRDKQLYNSVSFQDY
jgi:hypothetical protein